MKLKVAFAGFRHGHIRCLYDLVQKHPDLEIVASCEESQAEAGSMLDGIKITHDDFDRMLKDSQIDIIAIGDYFGKRGSLLVRSLQAGKHVIADKPICTSLAELELAAKLASEKGLKIGCQLDMRAELNLVKARELIRGGRIGEVNAISFGGQHPLLKNSRPKWYFEEGKHGGVINDIAIHGIDIVEWVTGLEFVEVNAARSWNATAGDCKFFNDAGQFMLTMSNGCGVLGDISYFSPDSCGYSLPYYWNFFFWGSKGVIRANLSDETIEMACDGEKTLQRIPRPANKPPDYLAQFLADIEGRPLELSTEIVLSASRKTLMIQGVADRKIQGVRLA